MKTHPRLKGALIGLARRSVASLAVEGRCVSVRRMVRGFCKKLRERPEVLTRLLARLSA